MVLSPRNGVSDVDNDAMELDSSNWCFAAMNTPRGPAGTLLVDSDADYHLSSLLCKRVSIEKECEVGTERCARQSFVSPWHTTRQSEGGNTGTASEH